MSLDDAARARNAAAAEALAALLEAGTPVYGVTTGVGPLRSRELGPGERSGHQLRLLRSHACGAGRPLAPERVRAALVVRANQIGAGGAGVSDDLLDASVAALNAGFVPFSRELGSLGTGDLTVLADIALALLGEGRGWREGRVGGGEERARRRGPGRSAPWAARRAGLHEQQRRGDRARGPRGGGCRTPALGFAGGGGALVPRLRGRPGRARPPRSRGPRPPGPGRRGRAAARAARPTRRRRRRAAAARVRYPRPLPLPRTRPGRGGERATPWSSSTPCSRSS